MPSDICGHGVLGDCAFCAALSRGESLQSAIKAQDESESARSLPLTDKEVALREGAAILLQVATMQEHNEAIFNGKWKKGAKAWNGDFIVQLRNEGMAKVREAMNAAPPDGHVIEWRDQ